MLRSLLFGEDDERVYNASNTKKKDPKHDIDKQILPRSLFQENGNGGKEYGEDYIEDTHSEQLDRRQLALGQGLWGSLIT